MANKSFLKKLGITASCGAAFGLVASGVFISVDALQKTGTGAPAAIVAEAEKEAEPELALTGANLSETDDPKIETTAEASENETLTIEQIAEVDMPALVAITNTTVEELSGYYGSFGFFTGGRSSQPQTYESVSMGTGVIIGETNDSILIATNQHVIADATTLSVAFVDEAAADAVVLGESADTDLAVISVSKSSLTDETLGAIRVISLGSSDNLKVGEQVVAIGNALGYGQSVSTGIVSAKNRVLMSKDGSTEGTDNGLIQTDAAINPGNSGGALLNMKGELVGINSAKYADTEVEGMGYAIPIDEALPILKALIDGKSADAAAAAEISGNGACLGITVTSVSPNYSQYYEIPTGVYVKEVAAGSAAEKAGIKAGDIITAIDDVKVTAVNDLTSLLAGYKPGDTIKVTLSREFETGCKTGTATVTLGSRTAEQTGYKA
ncbi:MAG: trypsin-like peptidase domain-containing protein [Lachnospiraceae bacterium]|nr:trypsin-like peptidase domain-containing protein [Lachnospiraceae bacterium]